MTTGVVSRRRAVGLLAGATAASLALVRRPQAQAPDKLTYQTGWRAQAQHGGIYQAIGAGIYRQHGLAVEMRHGGPQLDINTLLLSGQVDFIESNLFGALNYARENLPGIAVAAFFQKDERVLLAHPGVGNDSLPALKGKTILISTAGRQSFWQWLKAKYGYTDDQARPYTFSMAPFLSDKNMCQQGFLTTEPFVLRAAGVNPVIHLLADHGFDNYQSLMMCSPRLVSEKADVVQRFVDATIKGWASYLAGDPAPGNALIKRDNPDMTDDRIAYAISTMREYKLADGGDAARLGLGAMTAERWRSFTGTWSRLAHCRVAWPSTGFSPCSSSTSASGCCRRRGAGPTAGESRRCKRR
jgi:NitT/TauT family transport system substrate-binding protein